MVGRTQKRSSTPKPTTSTTVTGRRVKRRPEAEPTTAAKPKKAVKHRATAKPRAIRDATRATHRVISTREKSVTFTLDAPSAWSVAIAGTFNNWEPQAMAKGPDALWRIALRLAPGTYEDKFLVDAEWREDPKNPGKKPNASGGFNSVCEVM
jgi:hypothetical protein